MNAETATGQAERPDLRSLLVSLDLTERPVEEGYRRDMLALLGAEPNCFNRNAFPAHFTGSALVISADRHRVLLHHHRKLHRWLQFGGHCDGDHDVLRVARREALEESGIANLIADSELPFDLDIHPIPAYGSEAAHWHYDVRYLLLAPAEAVERLSDESHELRWFTPEELQPLSLSPGLRRMIAKWVG